MWKKKSQTNNWFLFILLVGICLSITGCKDTQKLDDNTISFTDALGRTVVLEEQPQRVATLIGSFADIWQLAGGSVCATAEDAWNDLHLDLGDATNIGSAHSPNLEILLSTNPDFVIASASTASNVKLQENLENAGITVAYFDVDCFEDYLHMLDICTTITDRKDLYQTNGLDLQKQINRIKELVSEAKLPPKKRTILLLRASASSVKAKSSEGTILGEMLKDMGCINIADQDTLLLENLSIESIMKQNPYHIFVVTMGDHTEQATKNLQRVMNENSAWANLDAIKENRMHIMDRKLFNMKPNAKWAKSYEILREIILQK